MLIFYYVNGAAAKDRTIISPFLLLLYQIRQIKSIVKLNKLTFFSQLISSNFSNKGVKAVFTEKYGQTPWGKGKELK